MYDILSVSTKEVMFNSKEKISLCLNTTQQLLKTLPTGDHLTQISCEYTVKSNLFDDIKSLNFVSILGTTLGNLLYLPFADAQYTLAYLRHLKVQQIKKYLAWINPSFHNTH